jgi:hypothetical protein
MDDFQNLRFILFCRLAGEPAGRVEDFQLEVEEEQSMQAEMKAASAEERKVW